MLIDAIATKASHCEIILVNLHIFLFRVWGHISTLLVTHLLGPHTSTKLAENPKEMMMETWGRATEFYDWLIKFH